MKRKERRIDRFKPYWPAAAAVIVLSTFIVFAFNPDEPGLVPEKLWGEWTTTSPKYADRFFQLEKRLITIGTGKTSLDVFLISNVEGTPGRQGEAYKLTYSDFQGVVYDFVFHYRPDDGGSIQLKNRSDIVWKKKKKEDDGSLSG